MRVKVGRKGEQSICGAVQVLMSAVEQTKEVLKRSSVHALSRLLPLPHDDDADATAVFRAFTQGAALVTVELKA